MTADTTTPAARAMRLGAQITALFDADGASKVERYAALAIAKAQVIVSDAPITSQADPGVAAIPEESPAGSPRSSAAPGAPTS